MVGHYILHYGNCFKNTKSEISRTGYSNILVMGSNEIVERFCDNKKFNDAIRKDT